ncbi:MAG: hypothetical protein GWP91_08435 [Rhodobacterales bacterium]|nr:hypothetical protein [Rhodobacterales bacterium]
MQPKMVLGLALTLGVAFTASAWIPEVEAPKSRPAVEDLGLANVDTSAEALDAVLARRDARVVLTQLASNPDADLAARGWAIVGLTRLPAGANTDAALDELRDGTKNPLLVRTWAAAARLDRIEDFDELVSQGRFVQMYPSLARPYKMAIEGAIGTVDSPHVLIRLAATQPQLNNLIGPRILAMSVEELAGAIYARTDDQTRRTAAAYAATKANQGDRNAMAQATIDALTFDGGQPPWSGGALYVPSLGWTGPQAKALVSELVRWSLYCADRPELRGERQQIGNNLASVGLLRQAGFRSGLPQDPAQMVQTYAQVMGHGAAQALLQDLRLTDDSRFASVSR